MLTRATRSEYAMLLDAAVLRPDADDTPAIVYVETDMPDVTITRRQFRAEVMRCAEAMRANGIAPHDLVIIAHTQSLESIYAFWGALVLGAIPSVFPTLTDKLDPVIYLNNLAELVSLSDVRAILTTTSFAPSLRARVVCPVYTSEDLATKPNLTPVSSPFGEGWTHHPIGDVGGVRSQPASSVFHGNEARSNPDNIAFLQHSSGTTGLQKGVALSHRAVLNQLAAYGDSIALNTDDVIVSWLPLYHDMGLIAGFLMPLIQGVPLVLMSPFDWVAHPALLLRTIHQYAGTLCWLPNFAYNHMARRIRSRDVEDVSLATMRMFINCSEPVQDASHAEFLKRFAAHGARADMLAVSYAMAENVFGVTQTQPGSTPHLDIVDRTALERCFAAPAHPSEPDAVIKVSCGAPISGTEVRVMAEYEWGWAALPERRVGELLVRSDCMLTGYYKRNDLDPFVSGWYRTGDRGYMADGEVYITGRAKDLIINAGKNIYPQDIEAIVNTVEGIHAGRAVVFGVPDAREGTEVIVVVAELDEGAHRRRVASEVRAAVLRACGVTVSYVELVDARWLLKTSSGKISRAANREKWLKSRDAEV